MSDTKRRYENWISMGAGCIYIFCKEQGNVGCAKKFAKLCKDCGWLWGG